MAGPNLFIVGAPKCGTTAWYHYLKRRSDIAFPEAKEPHYFSTDFPEFRWVRDEESYGDLFRGLPQGRRYVGEASVMYLYSKVAAASIAKFDPQAKVLAFIRDYPSFLVSYHNQLVVNHDEAETDFRVAWEAQEKRGKGVSVPSECRDAAFLQYRDVARFADQISRYKALFPPSQFKVIVYEEWTADPAKTYLEILDFLGLDDDGHREFPRINQARRDRSRRIGKFLQRPPKTVMAGLGMVKRLTGMERLGLSRWVRSMNQTEAVKRAPVDEALARQIRAELASDREKLEELLERRLDCWPRVSVGSDSTNSAGADSQ